MAAETGRGFPRSIPDMVVRAARAHGAAEALVDCDRGRRMSYTELGEQLTDVVRATMALGLRPGDRAAIWAPNSVEWVLAALGVLGAGGVLVPLNTRYTAAEAGDVLERTDARALFTVTGFLDLDLVGMARTGAPGSPALEHTVVLSGTAPAGTIDLDAFLAGGRSVPEDDARRRIDAVGPDDVSDLMVTSGTTARPKLVPLTHGQSLRAHITLGDLMTLRPGDRHLVVPPFFHTFGYKAGWMSGLAHGVTVIPQQVFDAAVVLDRLRAERVSVLCGPPTLFSDLLARASGSAELAALRVVQPAATTVPAELVRVLSEDVGVEVVITSYGLTEATSFVSTCRPDDDLEAITTTVGRPGPDIEVRIADPATGAVLTAGARGEVQVRGYNVMSGYWDDPAATAAAIDPDGWLHTGDLGLVDADGRLRIVDRLKDVVLVGGFTVSPAEIEQVLRGHPDVVDVAVVAAPDERLGEVPAAFVVAAGTPPDTGELLTWARRHLAGIKVPRRVEFVGSLPRNASAKVLKNELRACLPRTGASP